MDQAPTTEQQPIQPLSTVAASPVKNPGKTLGIVGIVLSFFFLQLIGIVLSIISTVKSSRAHASTTLGIIGIALNTIGLLSLPILAMITIVAYNGIQGRSQLVAVKTTANEVVQRAEAYYALEGHYPATIEDFANHDETKLVENGEDLSVTSGTPLHYEGVQYELCGPNGAHVVYYDPTVGAQTEDALVDMPLINASRLADCK